MFNSNYTALSVFVTEILNWRRIFLNVKAVSATFGGHKGHNDWWIQLPAEGFLLVFYSNDMFTTMHCFCFGARDGQTDKRTDKWINHHICLLSLNLQQHSGTIISPFWEKTTKSRLSAVFVMSHFYCNMIIIKHLRHTGHFQPSPDIHWRNKLDRKAGMWKTPPGSAHTEFRRTSADIYIWTAMGRRHSSHHSYTGLTGTR